MVIEIWPCPHQCALPEFFLVLIQIKLFGLWGLGRMYSRLTPDYTLMMILLMMGTTNHMGCQGMNTCKVSNLYSVLSGPTFWSFLSCWNPPPLIPSCPRASICPWSHAPSEGQSLTTEWEIPLIFWALSLNLVRFTFVLWQSRESRITVVEAIRFCATWYCILLISHFYLPFCLF